MTDQIIEGPWKATRLWNSIVRSLQDGIPLKKHRRNMRTYENCFTGTEAVDWLHNHLKSNPNFDGDVTREQALRLLQKLIKAGVIEAVHQSMGSIIHSRTVKSSTSTPALTSTTSIQSGNDLSSNLFRLADAETLKLHTPKKSSVGQLRHCPKSASTNSTFGRTPLVDISTKDFSTKNVSTKTARDILRNSFRRTKNKHRNFPTITTAEPNDTNSGTENNLGLKERHSMNLSYLQSLPPNSLVVLDDNGETWKNVFVTQLSAVLSEAHLRDLSVNLSYIIYNMTNVSARGVVQLTSDKSADLPRWCLSAMKCLANWPMSAANAQFPNYRGFEMDVFSVVRDYFVGLSSPLVSQDLYDIFVSSFIKARTVGVRTSKKLSNSRFPRPESRYIETDLDSVYTSTPSSSQAKFYTMQHEQYQYLPSHMERLARVRHTMEVMPTSHSSSLSNSLSPQGSNKLTPDMSATAIMRNFLPPNTCFETAFMNENPVTRIVPQKETETILLQREGRPLCQTPISSLGSLRSGQWDSRSIATQTSQDEEDQPRTRQPRWKRSTRFRKSIAVMDSEVIENRESKSALRPASAQPRRSSIGYVKGYSSLDNLLNAETDEEESHNQRLLQRFRRLEMEGFSRQRDISTPNMSNSKCSPDMIPSKTVRKEKRKQRYKRDLLQSPTATSASPLPSWSTLPSQSYRTSQYQDLIVKTPYFVDPSCNPDGQIQCVRAEPYNPSHVAPGQSIRISEEGVQCAIDSFKLLSLLIPPASRRKLQLLLKFMRRVANKENLQLDPTSRSCLEVTLDTFSEVILKPKDFSNYDEELCREIVKFFVEYYDAIWMPPVSLRKEVEERVYQGLVSKRLEAGEDPYPITFCERVPSKVYEEERQTGAEAALADLLDHILSDVKMNGREKRKKLEKFREAYPKIWSKKFPQKESEPDCLKSKTQEKSRFPSLSRLKNTIRL